MQRDFGAAGRNQLWVADFTYLRAWEGLVFFAFLSTPTHPRRLAQPLPELALVK